MQYRSRCYVLLVNQNRRFYIAKDYGDYAWDDTALHVVEYFDSYRDAQRSKRELMTNPDIFIGPQPSD